MSKIIFMKKLFISSLALATLSAPAFALDSQWFIGTGIGYQNAEIKHSELIQDGTTDSNDAVYQLQTGVVLNKYYRISFEYQYADTTVGTYDRSSLYPRPDIDGSDDRVSIHDKSEKYNLEQNLFLLSYDYIMPLSPQFNIVTGLMAGVTQNEITIDKFELDVAQNKPTTSKAQHSSTDFTWGAKLGAEFNINDQWSTELTYRYLTTDDVEFVPNTKGTDIVNQQIMLNVNYKF